VSEQHCTIPGEVTKEWKCPCCRKCWLYVRGPRMGRCIVGGPFTGYLKDGKLYSLEELEEKT
jgi:hypothetical protein